MSIVVAMIGALASKLNQMNVLPFPVPTAKEPAGLSRGTPFADAANSQAAVILQLVHSGQSVCV